MDLNTLPKTKQENGEIIFGPLTEKQYQEVKTYLWPLGVGYHAELVDKKSYLVMTNSKQLARGGIVL
jgi:hypothetical protein